MIYSKEIDILMFYKLKSRMLYKSSKTQFSKSACRKSHNLVFRVLFYSAPAIILLRTLLSDL